jgi:hypothetical protein
MNGWLLTEGIQGISNYIKKIIVLIYLDSCTVQMFFPDNKSTFLLKKKN